MHLDHVLMASQVMVEAARAAVAFYKLSPQCTVRAEVFGSLMVYGLPRKFSVARTVWLVLDDALVRRSNLEHAIGRRGFAQIYYSAWQD